MRGHIVSVVLVKQQKLLLKLITLYNRLHVSFLSFFCFLIFHCISTSTDALVNSNKSKRLMFLLKTQPNCPCYNV